MINTINGFTLLVMISSLIVGCWFGISMQSAREVKEKRNDQDDFIDFLKGSTIEAQMEKDGWKL